MVAKFWIHLMNDMYSKTINGLMSKNYHAIWQYAKPFFPEVITRNGKYFYLFFHTVICRWMVITNICSRLLYLSMIYGFQLIYLIGLAMSFHHLKDHKMLLLMNRYTIKYVSGLTQMTSILTIVVLIAIHKVSIQIACYTYVLLCTLFMRAKLQIGHWPQGDRLTTSFCEMFRLCFETLGKH